MSSPGYTLAETLAALLIISLSIGGMLAGAAAVERAGHRATERASASDSSGALSRTLRALLEDQGPFLANTAHALEGSPDALSFPCSEGSCGARLVRSGDAWTLAVSLGAGAPRTFALGAGPSAPRFVFQTLLGPSEVWPPSQTSAMAETSQPLVAVDLDGPGGDPLATARVGREQSGVCAFDAVSRSCRDPGS